MIAEPPVSVGAVQVRATEASAAVPASEVGTPGVVMGVTASLALEAVPSPIAVVAVTLKVYAEPLSRPVMVHVVVVPSVVSQYAPPGVATARCLVRSEPPVVDGSSHVTMTWPSPAVPATTDGAPGVVAGVPAAAAEAVPSPALLVAVTVTE